METFVDVLEQISILIGIWVAIYGIDSWRREHRGKRQVELAEDALSLFYEAQDAIAGMRHPASYVSETEHIERGEHESEKAFEARKNAAIVFVRYEKHSELFNKIHAMRYRFMALIGKEEAKPFEDLRAIVNEIFIAARMLGRLWPQEYFRKDGDREKHYEKIMKYEEVFWGVGGEEDPIEPRVVKVIEEMEKICAKVIAGKPSLHRFLSASMSGKG